MEEAGDGSLGGENNLRIQTLNMNGMLGDNNLKGAECCLALPAVTVDVQRPWTDC